MKETMKLKGHFKVRLFDENGFLREVREVKNTVVTAGKNFLAAWLIAATQSTSFMSYQGLGTGTTAAQASDVDLETPLATRVQGALTSTTNVWKNEATFGAGVNTGAVTEAGLFSLAAAGTMLARQVFPVVNKQAGDTLVITWEITFS